jgi:hypothetical protein
VITPARPHHRTRRTSPAAVARAALTTVLALTPACEIVDEGPDVGVAERCVVSSSFFLERIVPEYLERYECRSPDGSCHDANTGQGVFRLADTSDSLPPSPTDPLAAWSEAWRANFESTAFQVGACNPELAPLYAKPAGGDTLAHGGGELFAEDGPELDLLRAWLEGEGL